MLAVRRERYIRGVVSIDFYQLGDKSLVVGDGKVVKGGVEGCFVVAGGKLIPQGIANFLSGGGLWEAGEKLRDSGKAASTVVEFVVKCVVEVKDNHCYHSLYDAKYGGREPGINTSAITGLTWFS